MFALFVNECSDAKRDFVIEVTMNFVIFSSPLDLQASFACNRLGECACAFHTEKIRPASRRADALHDTIDSALSPKWCIAGTNCEPGSFLIVLDRRVEIRRKPSLDGLSIGLYDAETVATVVTSRRRWPLWMGWFREPGIDLVFVHHDRNAISAATGCCGCLFDEKLQLWLMEAKKLIVYALGDRNVRVMADGEEDSTSAGP